MKLSTNARCVGYKKMVQQITCKPPAVQKVNWYLNSAILLLFYYFNNIKAGQESTVVSKRGCRTPMLRLNYKHTVSQVCLFFPCWPLQFLIWLRCSAPVCLCDRGALLAPKHSPDDNPPTVFFSVQMSPSQPGSHRFSCHICLLWLWELLHWCVFVCSW